MRAYTLAAPMCSFYVFLLMIEGYFYLWNSVFLTNIPPLNNLPLFLAVKYKSW